MSRDAMRGAERIWVGIHHAPTRIRHETPPNRTSPSPRPRLPGQQGRPDYPGADTHPRSAVIRRELPSANITANSTPFRATLVFRSHLRLRDRERTWRLNSSTDWKEGRKEGSQDKKEEEGRQELAVGLGDWPPCVLVQPAPLRPGSGRPLKVSRRPEAPAPRSGQEQTLPAQAGSPKLPLSPPRLFTQKRREHHS